MVEEREKGEGRKREKKGREGGCVMVRVMVREKEGERDSIRVVVMRLW